MMVCFTSPGATLAYAKQVFFQSDFEMCMMHLYKIACPLSQRRISRFLFFSRALSVSRSQSSVSSSPVH